MKKLLPLLFLLLFAAPVWATQYYVAATGDDTCNDGLSQYTPWKTIARVNQQPFDVGDHISFRGGDSFTGTLIITNSGTAELPIVYDSYGTGQATFASGAVSAVSAFNVSGITITNLILTGSGSPNGIHGVLFTGNQITGLHDIFLNLLTVSGYGGDGIRVYGDQTGAVAIEGAGFHTVMITNNTVSTNKMDGIHVAAKFPNLNSDITISTNTVTGNTGIAGSGTAAGSGILLCGSSASQIDHNTVSGNGTLNNNTLAGPMGVLVCDAMGVSVLTNTVHDNHSTVIDGAGIGLSQNVSNSLIQFNETYNNDGAGYFLGHAPATMDWHDNRVLNNTSTDDAQLRDGNLALYGGIRGLTVGGNTLRQTSGSPPRAAVRAMGLSASGQCMDLVNFSGNLFTVAGPDLIRFATTPLACATNLSFLGNTYVGSPFAIVWGATTYTSCAAWHTATGQENCTDVAASPPTVTSVTPSIGTQGDSIALDIVGSDFQAGATCDFGSDIVITACIYNSSTSLTAQGFITTGADVGAHTLTVTNPDAQAGSLIGAFTVAAAPLPPPTVTSATPSSAAQGATALDVVIAGTDFQASPTCDFGSGITINSCTWNTSLQITANITIAGGATVGTRTVKVTNADLQFGSLAAGFSVTGATPPAPTVTSTTPNTGPQGSVSLAVTITGTGFQSGAACDFGAAGVTVTICNFVSVTTMNATITIDANATLGTRSVMVTNPDTQFGSGFVFSVVPAAAPAPTVTSVAPNSGNRSQTIASTIITGTGFQSGLTCSFGSGITVNSCTFNSSTQATANITIGAAAASGGRTVTVQNTDGLNGSLPNGFTVTIPPPAPTVTSVNPTSAAQGQSAAVGITGTGFQSGALASFSGTGITVNSNIRSSTTFLTANITISGGAALTARDVTITNTDTQSGTLPASFTVTAVVLPPPTVTSVNPTGSAQGQSLSVVITGTNFVSGATCSFGTGITINSCTFNSATQMTASITIAPGASIGTRNVTVQNPDTQQGVLSNGFTVRAVPVGHVTWTDNSSTETGFSIQRSDNGAAYVQVGTVLASITSFDDTSLPFFITFCYQVIALGSPNSAPGGGSGAACTGPLTP